MYYQNNYYPNYQVNGGYPNGYPPNMYPYNNYAYYNTPYYSGYNNMPPNYYTNQQPNVSMGYSNGVSYNSPYSPFIDRNQVVQNIMNDPEPVVVNPDTYRPGSLGPLKVEKTDGTVEYIQPNNVPGGTTTSQGGFNPVTGTVVPQSQSAQGYMQNPYMTNSYVPSRYTDPYANNSMRNQYGYNPYPMTGYPMNQYNSQMLYEWVYGGEEPLVDFNHVWETAFFTKEERERLEKNRNTYVLSYDYYGRPVYNQTPEQRQEFLNTAREQVIEFYTWRSRLAHTYFGEEFDEEKARKFYDPIKEVPRPKSILEMTDKEKKELEKIQNYESCLNIFYQCMVQEQRIAAGIRFVNENMHWIKDSHDRMLGVKPGESYGFKQFSENAYNLLVDAAKQKVKLAMKDAGRRYSSTGFRQALAMNTGYAVPTLTDKTDEYVNLRDRIREALEDVQKDTILSLPDGTFAYKIAPPGVNQKEYEDGLYKHAIERKRKHDEILVQMRDERRRQNGELPGL